MNEVLYSRKKLKVYDQLFESRHVQMTAPYVEHYEIVGDTSVTDRVQTANARGYSAKFVPAFRHGKRNKKSQAHPNTLPAIGKQTTEKLIEI